MRRFGYSTALVGALLVVVLAGMWNTFAPDFLPAPEAEEPLHDSGLSLDPEHLTDKDILFLTDVLQQPGEAGRVSAARVLALSTDPRGVALLLNAHREGHDPGGVYCIAALEILRLQTWETTWRTLLLEMQRQPSVDPSCMSELSDRFALVGGAERARWMAEDDDPIVRAWVARALGPEDGQLLLVLTSDEDVVVRRAAWLAWDVRDTTGFEESLRTAADLEADPELLLLISEVLP